MNETIKKQLEWYQGQVAKTEEVLAAEKDPSQKAWLKRALGRRQQQLEEFYARWCASK